MHLAYPWDQEPGLGHDTIQTGDTLQNSSSWLTSFSFGYSWDFIDPHVDGFKGYLGTRKKIGDSYYYGWIEFKMFWDTSLSIYIPVPRLVLFRSAFCTIPDYPLLAGQTELAWSLEERQEQVEIYPNPTNGCVRIFGKDLKSAEIHNSLGQFVASTQGNGNQIEMDFSVLPAGVYFVKVTNKDGKCFVKKVIKQ
jgi:hypothetical protein